MALIRSMCAVGRSRRHIDPRSVIAELDRAGRLRRGSRGKTRSTNQRVHRREPQGPVGWGHAARGIEPVESEHLGMSFPPRTERRRGRSTTSTDRLHPSELMARRGMLLIVVTALVLAGAMVFVSGLATLQ